MQTICTGKPTFLLTETTPVIKLTLTPSANLEEGTYSFVYDSSEDVGDVIRMLSYKTSVGSTAGAQYTVTKDVTFTADITTVVPQPTKAETKVESEKVRDLTYDTDKASHFFEGIYSVTPNDEKVATFGVNVKSKADASKTKT